MVLLSPRRLTVLLSLTQQQQRKCLTPNKSHIIT